MTWLTQLRTHAGFMVDISHKRGTGQRLLFL